MKREALRGGTWCVGHEHKGKAGGIDASLCLTLCRRDNRELGILQEPQKLGLKLHVGLKILRDGWRFFFSFYVALLKSFDKWFWSRFLFFLQSMTKIIIICLRPKRIGFRRCVGMCVSVCCAYWSIDNMILLFMHSL